MFFATSVIAMAIIVILAWKLCSEKRKSGKPLANQCSTVWLSTYACMYYQPYTHFSTDVVTIPAPAQLQGQLNVDNIEMQSSPAYVSLDNKSPQLYQNI